MEFYYYIILTLFVSIIFFKKYSKFSKNIGLMDGKNLHYSSKITPTGSGIIFPIIFIIGNFVFFINGTFDGEIPNRYYLFILSSLILSVTSFRDDMRPIDPILRLLIQFGCIYISLSSLNIGEINLPLKLSMLIFFGIWVYITNICNFIDGTDGFLITHTLFFYLNIIFLYFIGLDDLFSLYLGLLILPTSLVFFYFNKPNAKLFMGDAGSIFLGFLIGYSFIEICIKGYWSIALSLMAYPLIDCSICLLKKLKKGIMPWIGIYDYYFLKPAIFKKKNHIKILILFSIFNFLNVFIIQVQFVSKLYYLCLLSLINSIILIVVFQNCKKLRFFN